jgi:hypothetical protein
VRKLLLIWVAALALGTTPAHADLPVIDATQIAKIAEQLGISQQQLQEMITTYNEIVEVYDVSSKIWGDVEELVSADQWAPGLKTGHNRNPLEFPALLHPLYLGGFQDPSSLQFGSTYVQQNTVGGDPSIYDDATFVGTEMKKMVWSLSAMQAVASNHLSEIETRITALGDLFVQLGKIGKLQETDSLSARLHQELNYAHSQQVQATQLQHAAEMQLAVFEHNQRQWTYQDETNGIQAACATAKQAASFVTIPACLK